MPSPPTKTLSNAPSDRKWTTGRLSKPSLIPISKRPANAKAIAPHTVRRLVIGPNGFDAITPADRAIAVEAVRNVIEFIEVTRLRGGAEANMDKDDGYAKWKAMQARAGQALLKIHKPEEAPIPEFDPLEFE